MMMNKILNVDDYFEASLYTSEDIFKVFTNVSKQECPIPESIMRDPLLKFVY